MVNLIIGCFQYNSAKLKYTLSWFKTFYLYVKQKSKQLICENTNLPNSKQMAIGDFFNSLGSQL